MRRDEFGAFCTLFDELRNHEDKFFNYFRMSAQTFDELHLRMKDSIQHRNTSFRECIQPIQMLAVTIRKMPKQFAESKDYVNLSPLRYGARNASADGEGTPDTPYSRSMTAIKTKMPAQSFFAPSNSFFNDEDSETVNLFKRGRPLHGAGLLGPPEPDLNVSVDLSGPITVNDKSNRKRNPEPVALETSTKKPKRRWNKPQPKSLKRILIGSVEYIIRWHKVARTAQLSYLYEAVGTLENWSVKGCATLLFLRGDLGQIIQGLFYSVDHVLPTFKTGDIVSMTGKMVGSHKMMVAEARGLEPEEKAAVQRLSFLCQRMLLQAAGNPQNVNM